MFWSAMVLAAALLTGDVLYDNGPFVTHVGTGAGGADESLTQKLALGMLTHGFGHRLAMNELATDDFEVPLCGWSVEAITFFAYQTGAPTSPSTITQVRLAIVDDVPWSTEADTLYGDLTTNVLTSSTWTGCYRLYDENTGAETQRPIMANRCELPTPVVLGSGVYWLMWQTGGTGPAGPWVPPITVNGLTTTGNAYQFDGTAWVQSNDGGTFTSQGFPFILEGRPTPVERTSWGAVKALFR